MKLHRLLALSTVAAASALAAIASASSAEAAEATGCRGQAVSFTAAGVELDRVTAPGPGGTEADPFQVDFDGTIRWSGTSDAVLQNGTWKVSIGGIPLSGEVTNDTGLKEAGGTDSIGSKLPGLAKAILQGKSKILVTGEVTGTGGSCTVAVWIQSANPSGASPIASPVGFVGIGAAIIGLGLLGGMLLGTKAAAAPAVAYTPPAPPPGAYPPPPPPGAYPPPPPPLTGGYPPPPPPPPG